VKHRSPDHYATLGLDPDCAKEDIRAAYRALAKQHHPDVNTSSPEEPARIQAINAAYATLGDDVRRRAYDAHGAPDDRAASSPRPRASVMNIQQDVHLGLRDFLGGIHLDVVVRDPAHPDGIETYPLDVPPDTAPGARFRIPRKPPFASGWVVVRIKARPDRQFKIKRSDLQCDLRINPRRAASGGAESVRGIGGSPVVVDIPPKVARGTILRVVGEGLPKPRGGRGDLLVRIMYRPEVSITRTHRAPPPASPRRRLGSGTSFGTR
jgi:DnaJ-class molecular chaperone